jgi:hypothetical protein
MASRNPRSTRYRASYLLHVELEQSERVKEYRFENRIPTESAALRKLIDLGLEAAGLGSRA